MPVIGTPVHALCDAPATNCDEACGDQINLPTPPLSGCGAATCAVSGVFQSLRVTPTIAFGSRVEWALSPQFRDPLPHTFQLQVGRTGLSVADDWQPVGSTADNVFYMLDDTQRVFGKTNWTHYRVCLETPVGTYFSDPIPADGDLSAKDRREWRTILKTWSTLLRLKTGQEGYLLKRKLFGTPCPEDCRDFQTGEITDPHCPTCHGTGIVDGYFDPVPCIYAQLSPRTSHNNLDAGQARGTIDDELRVRATLLGVPYIFENDVWVDKHTDRRWYIHQIQHRVEVRGVAAVVDAEFRLAPYTDTIYEFEIEDQVPS